MTTQKPNKPHKKANEKPGDGSAQSAKSAEQLASLLRDLESLQAYLQERGRHSYELAQRFLVNARRDSSSRAYDERQATMLEYQHYIWQEIAGRVSQLLVAYGDPEGTTEGALEGATDDAATTTQPPTREQDS